MKDMRRGKKWKQQDSRIWAKENGMPSLPHQNHSYLKLVSPRFRSILFLIRNFILFIPLCFSVIFSLSLYCFFSSDLKHAQVLPILKRLSLSIIRCFSPTSQLKFLKKLSPRDFSSNSHSFLTLSYLTCAPTLH